MRRRTVVTAAFLAVFATAAWADGGPSFDRDVKPILSSYCFACHGPDEATREEGLRLDTFEGATVDLNGTRAIVPGKPEASELIARITTQDPTERMPPRKTGKTLTPGQVEVLKKWIAGGAKYEKHWAFVPPVQPALPAVNRAPWVRNGIDSFVLARLESEGLAPAPEADAYTLVRRVHLDLVGLPPKPEEADAFVAEYAADPAAYERLVDRLLTMSAYGERWATPWLDLARYADTNGYEKDRTRSIWPYRDWVIHALNADMPFDRFTIEQLAGDMLTEADPGSGADVHGSSPRPGSSAPGPWPLDISRRIATGFHRNTMLNEEGGIDPLEFRHYAMLDRVATTGLVWMGLTTGCAQCHTHKYDPITHTDYHSLMALLNNADEPDLIVRDEDSVQRMAAIQKRIAELHGDLPNQFPPGEGDGPIETRRKQHFDAKLAAWVQSQQAKAIAWRVIRPEHMASNLPRLEVLADGSIFSTGDITKRDIFTLTFKLDPKQPITALRLEALPDDRLPQGGPGRCYYEGRKGDFFLSELTAAIDGQPARLVNASHSYGKNGLGSGNANAANVLDGDGSTGWATAGAEGQANQLVVNFDKPVSGHAELKVTLLFERHYAASLGRFRLALASSDQPVQATTLPVEVEAALAKPASLRSDVESLAVRSHFLSIAHELGEARKKIDALKRTLPALPTTLVMQERQADNPRPTHRHHRGEYLQPREEVKPALPSLFAPANPRVSDRLGLAKWLVSDSNPLVDRVTVNRAWAEFFGRGIVETLGDFGTQGAAPTHPQLLDWLAVRFRQDGLSMKRLHRLIVTSATYRQSSASTQALLARDPQNLLLARGPRFRMTGEMIRDSAMHASGLLSAKVGGPSVYPPQPASVTDLAYGNTKWPVSAGQDRYRRSLYTFRKRTAPFAAYLTFDGPTGENCVVQRDRSNSPLQSLTLLNDAMFLESARALATGAIKEGASDRQRVEGLWRRVLTRPARAGELDALLAFHADQLARLKSGELKASDIAAAKDAQPERAAWVMVARVILNLDEAVTKP